MLRIIHQIYCGVSGMRDDIESLPREVVAASEADEDEDTFMVFNVEKAGPFIFMMLITYHISYPLRWFIGLFG